MKKVRNLAVMTLLASAFAAPAFTANAQHHGGGSRGPSRGFHGHDIGRFGGHDSHVWQGGHWEHGWHGERFGWWWTFGAPWWYPYAAPIYPYPDPYIPSAVLVEPAAPVVADAPPQSRYYCDNPKGYYPYIPTCSGAWRPVSPMPPKAP